MASIIQFGGTNGVPEIDFGLLGGALYIAGTARSTMKLIEGVQRAPETKVAMPDQAAVAISRGGAQGRTIRAEGQFVLDSHASMNALLDAIELRRTSSALMVPTQLKNNNSGQIWSKVVLDDFRALGARRITSGNRVTLGYVIIFEVLR